MHSHRLASSGQSLQEYALPIALVVIVGVVSLTAIGTNVSDLFSGMIGKRVPQTPTVASVSTVLPASSGGAVSTANLQLELSDGSRIQLANFPTRTSQAVETVGVDGTTELYGKSILDLADALEQSGKLDPDQLQILRQLGTSGFDIAIPQKDLKSEFSKLQRQATLTPLEYNDAFDTYVYGSFHEKANCFASCEFQINVQPYIDNPRLEIPTEMMGKRLSQITELYKKAEASGVLNDPAIRSVVERSYFEILRLNFSAIQEAKEKQRQLFIELANGAITARVETNKLTLGTFEQKISKNIQQTESESDAICTEGRGDGSSRVKCVKKG